MSLRVAKRLEDEGHRIRVVDLRWLSPLPVDDMVTAAEAAKKAAAEAAKKAAKQPAAAPAKAAQSSAKAPAAAKAPAKAPSTSCPRFVRPREPCPRSKFHFWQGHAYIDFSLDDL